ncbi:D-glycero-beta-D-manno-heptose 1-phosphate adenylyltransferase [Actinoallomurus iriomotensis]|uniref:D-glycero-beta-D-manno-heptose 1-phosphate adenylyltransferase n=1 Tax=Actinoallomurus iriomotensis TaxID=478107 RepID=A0A9W6S228_9ACTN|nr:D-glycero-beta-D-manno-heptose 1-phosphate adenylyltransferase [Actinoallomurus iriomotensis]GLY85846.1 bifunctional protein HldE [Actinoallomurus iriomotensis]
MKPVVIVGDVVLDRDLDGQAERLSPDAPVPVVDAVEEHTRPGGAGLAALLAADDGPDVVLVTPLGADRVSRTLRDLLAPRVRVVALPLSESPAEKTRVRAGGHPLVRIDRTAPGAVGEPGREVEAVLADAGAVLVSDYGRGTAAQPRMRELLADAARRVPLVWDPHPRGADPVPRARLICPNLTEALAWCDRRDDDLDAVTRSAEEILRRYRADGVVVTMGERGALLSHGSGAPQIFPAERVTGRDTCGAGDRFAATAARLLARGALPSEAVEAAVAAAAAFVERGAASALSQTPAPRPVRDPVAAVREAGGTVVATGGCFDVLHAGHVATLRAARALGDCLVVCLNSDASVRRAKGPDRPVNPAADRAAVLNALECVDAVEVFEEDTPEEILRRLRPDVWVKGGDYTVDRLPEASVVASWGGRTVVLPYLPGRSTTRILAHRS